MGIDPSNESFDEMSLGILIVTEDVLGLCNGLFQNLPSSEIPKQLGEHLIIRRKLFPKSAQHLLDVAIIGDVNGKEDEEGDFSSDSTG